MKSELERVLKNFYEHATGTDDYGCEGCKKYETRILDIFKLDDGEILDVMELEACNKKKGYPTYGEMAKAIANHYNNKIDSDIHPKKKKRDGSKHTV